MDQATMDAYLSSLRLKIADRRQKAERTRIPEMREVYLREAADYEAMIERFASLEPSAEVEESMIAVGRAVVEEASKAREEILVPRNELKTKFLMLVLQQPKKKNQKKLSPLDRITRAMREGRETRFEIVRALREMTISIDEPDLGVSDIARSRAFDLIFCAWIFGSTMKSIPKADGFQLGLAIIYQALRAQDELRDELLELLLRWQAQQPGPRSGEADP